MDVIKERPFFTFEEFAALEKSPIYKKSEKTIITTKRCPCTVPAITRLDYLLYKLDLEVCSRCITEDTYLTLARQYSTKWYDYVLDFFKIFSWNARW